MSTKPKNTNTPTTTEQGETKKTKTGKFLQKLAEEHGGLTPELVVEAARREESPIHRLFCWDDGKAAEEWRLHQASQLIRRIRVIVVEPDETKREIRAFVNITPERKDLPGVEEPDQRTERGLYLPYREAMAEYNDQVLERARRDALAFQQKYATLKEVSKVIDAIIEVFAE